ncbi:MAG: hypothetical protein IT429_00775 [Gemmataceae bacterium]|nr:hypothetical protein [Gemmataceae bacterium]
MPQRSSYVRYLPPVLWEDESGDLPLGQLLCIFETLLTGLDDGADLPTLGRPGLSHEPLTATIDRVHELFDPWRTPEAFLPWLASWVALEFPTHPVADGGRQPLWDVHQRRKVTAEIAQIYRLRGLKEGLTRLIDLYTGGTPRPRVVVDDGCRLWSLGLSSEAGGQPVSVVSRNPGTYFTRVRTSTGRDEQQLTVTRAAPVHPRCLALAPDGALFLGDLGAVGRWLDPGSTSGSSSAVTPPKIEAGIWRFPSLGTVTTADPQRIALRMASGESVRLENPMALVVDPAPPGTLYILDRRDNAGADVGFVLQVALSDLNVVTRIDVVEGTRWPVAMDLDPDRRLVILDRGGSIPAGEPAAARLLRFSPPNLPAALRPSFPSNLLPPDCEPLSLALLADGSVLVGEGGRQSDASPGGLIHITRGGSSWRQERLAIDSPGNPLVAPVALVETEPHVVTVVDLGLKPHAVNVDPNDASLGGDAYLRHRSEPASVHRVDLRTAPATVAQVAENGQLVHPTDAIAVGPTLYIADAGESAPAGTYFTPREWRAEPHAFGLVVHFPLTPDGTGKTRRQQLRTITEIVTREMPAHTSLFYAFDYADNI